MNKLGCVVRMVVDSILLQTTIGKTHPRLTKMQFNGKQYICGLYDFIARLYSDRLYCRQKFLLQFLLWSDAAGVTTFLLSAVYCSWMESSIALAADHLVTVILLSQNTKGWLNDTTTKTKYQMKGWFLLNVIVWKGSTVFQLLTSKDKTLLIWWNTLFVLKYI